MTTAREFPYHLPGYTTHVMVVARPLWKPPLWEMPVESFIAQRMAWGMSRDEVILDLISELWRPRAQWGLTFRPHGGGNAVCVVQELIWLRKSDGRSLDAVNDETTCFSPTARDVMEVVGGLKGLRALQHRRDALLAWAEAT